MIVRFNATDTRRTAFVRLQNRQLGENIVPLPYPVEAGSPIAREILVGVAVYVLSRLIDRAFFGGRS